MVGELLVEVVASVFGARHAPHESPAITSFAISFGYVDELLELGAAAVVGSLIARFWASLHMWSDAHAAT